LAKVEASTSSLTVALAAFVISTIAVSLCGRLISWQRFRIARRKMEKIMLAVCLQNLTGDPKQEYFGRLTEEMMPQLSRLHRTTGRHRANTP